MKVSQSGNNAKTYILRHSYLQALELKQVAPGFSTQPAILKPYTLILGRWPDFRRGCAINQRAPPPFSHLGIAQPPAPHQTFHVVAAPVQHAHHPLPLIRSINHAEGNYRLHEDG